jgi:type II secretory pathway component PulM
MKPLDNLPARDRRALLIGLTVLLPALAFVAVIRPYLRAERSSREAIALERDALARELDLVEHAPTLPREISEASMQLATATRRLYTGAEPVAATAALARDVRKAFDDAGALVMRMDARDAAVMPTGMRDLSIEVRASGDIESILAAIASLESGRKLVRVTRIAIDRDGIREAGGAQPLAAIATIHGYAR